MLADLRSPRLCRIVRRCISSCDWQQSAPPGVSITHVTPVGYRGKWRESRRVKIDFNAKCLLSLLFFFQKQLSDNLRAKYSAEMHVRHFFCLDFISIAAHY